MITEILPPSEKHGRKNYAVIFKIIRDGKQYGKVYEFPERPTGPELDAARALFRQAMAEVR
ncbi:MAG: hypothetical protein IT566_10065 [Rhodospirillaceae bacterium]|nr:hypothetical protein [Rhodospirillaceae bacterium]